MSDDLGKNQEGAAKDIGKSLSDAAQSEELKKAQAQAKEGAERAAKKADETLKQLQKNESVRKAEEQARQAADELGKGLKGFSGFLKKKVDEVNKK